MAAKTEENPILNKDALLDLLENESFRNTSYSFIKVAITKLIKYGGVTFGSIGLDGVNLIFDKHVQVLLLDLFKNESFRHTTLYSFIGATITSLTTFGGGLFGPIGLVSGSVVGSVIAFSLIPKFKPLHQILSEMSPEEKALLFNEFKNVIFYSIQEAIECKHVEPKILNNQNIKDKIVKVFKKFNYEMSSKQ